MYATDVCALEIYHRMQHIEINFYIRYNMTRHPYSTPAAFSWWCRWNCKKRLGLLNFTWGSWKLCVGSPTVSNFSKLVSTPVYVEYSNLAHSMSGMVELYPSIKNVLPPKITELWCIVQGRQWNRKNDFLRFTHFIYNESIEIVTLLYSCWIHHACYDYSRTGHDKWFAAELMNWKWTVRGRLIRLVIKKHAVFSIISNHLSATKNMVNDALAAQPEDDAPAESHALIVSFREVSTAVDVGIVPLTCLPAVCYRARCHNKRQQCFPRLLETE